MKIKIRIKKQENGYICIDKNGDCPFEGRVHASKIEAMRDLQHAYFNDTWKGRLINGSAIEIETE